MTKKDGLIFGFMFLVAISAGCSSTRAGTNFRSQRPIFSPKPDTVAQPTAQSGSKVAPGISRTTPASPDSVSPSSALSLRSSPPATVASAAPVSTKARTEAAVPVAIASELTSRAPAGMGTERMPTELRRPDGTARRLHIRFDSAEAFDHFMAAWKARQRIQEDAVVLLRILDEIGRRLESANARLQDELGIQQDRQYRYDAAQSTIFELSPDRPDAAPRVHRRLATDDQRRQFAELIAVRDNSRVQVQVLNLTLRDKRAALDQLQEGMLREYAMSRDRDYQVNENEKTLYEFIRAPSALGAPAVRGSK